MTAAPQLSVLLCTHNPRADFLAETLAALERQSMPTGVERELIITDNASNPPLRTRTDIVLPDRARLVEERQLGLTHARLRSFRESRADILIYVDDDNVLDPSYLSFALDFMRRNPRVGALGGKVLPQYEAPPPPWFDQTGLSLACRDLGGVAIEARWEGGMHDRSYPACAPIGAGMVLRRSAYASYIDKAANDPARLKLGRRGADLSSGEDNDIVMTMLADGWSVAYRPELSIMHLIPRGRLSPAYLRRYAYASNRTWVQVLGLHGIRPWSAIAPATAPLRKARAWLRTQPWSGPSGAVAWAGACGLIDGRAALG